MTGEPPDTGTSPPPHDLPPGFHDDVAWVVNPPRRKFQHRWGIHLALFALTLFTTTFAGQTTDLVMAPFYWVWTQSFFNPLDAFTWDALIAGLGYSIPVMSILTAHELGHYFACRAYNVDATLPYFLPAPITFTGTLGAVIRIREPFPSKRALFDIGVAGPIAGFVVLVPFLVWGLWLSDVRPVPGGEHIYFGEPLLWKTLEWLRFGAVPDGYDVYTHPMGIAAWFGMLATALNLLPFGQLDGGHIIYSVFGARAARISMATLGLVVVLTFWTVSWVLFAVMLIAMAYLVGFQHPRVWDEHIPLDPGRRAIALFAVIIFILCFTPVPIEIIGE